MRSVSTLGQQRSDAAPRMCVFPFSWSTAAHLHCLRAEGQGLYQRHHRVLHVWEATDLVAKRIWSIVLREETQNRRTIFCSRPSEAGGG